MLLLFELQMYIQLFYLLGSISFFVGLILPLFLVLGFFITIIQRQQCQNVVGFYDIFQDMECFCTLL